MRSSLVRWLAALALLRHHSGNEEIMASQLLDGRFRGETDAGLPLVGGLLYTYASGTTMPKVAYTDSTLGTAATNPLVLNARGEAQVWLGTGAYSLKLTDPAGVTIWTTDGVNSADVAGTGQAAADALRTDLASTSADKGASLVALRDSAGNWEADTVEELAAEIKPKFRKSVNTTAELIAAAALGGGLRIADGAYTLTEAIELNYSSTSFPAPGLASTRVDLVGDSRANTILTQTANGATAIHAVGRADAAYQGVHGIDEISNLTIDRSGAGLNTGIGIKIEHKAYTKVADLVLTKHNTGLWLNGVLSSVVQNCYITGNTIGIVTDFVGSALLPNAIGIENCQIADNSVAGMISNVLGCTFGITGGSVENNGTTGVAGEGGLLLNVRGNNGTASITLTRVYFEANGGDADIQITNTGGHHLTVNMVGCTFNRVLGSRYTATNIKLVNTGGGTITCVLIGCGFLSGGDYPVSSSRPFWQADSSSQVIDIGCTYSEGTSRPASCRATESTVIASVVEITGDPISSLPPGVTISKTGTGVYRITRSGGWGFDQWGYVAIANAQSSTSRANVININENAFDVRTLNGAGAAADERFSFMVTRFH
jgi:hypothetical protein